MRKSLPTITLLGLLTLAFNSYSLASTIDGKWQADFKGEAHYFQTEPSTKPVASSATLIIQSSGDRLTVDVAGIDGVLSARRLTGSQGKDGFSAVDWDEARQDQTTVIFGRLDGDRIEGKLIHPRAAQGLPSGWTELTFVATREQPSSRSVATPLDRRRLRRPDLRSRMPQEDTEDTAPSAPSARTPGMRVPTRPKLPISSPALRPGSSSPTPQGDTFSFELLDVTEPAEPTSAQQIRFGLRATPPRGTVVERVELWVNERKIASAAGDTIDMESGPYPVGQLTYSLVAFSEDGARAESEERSLTVQQAGSAVISGTVSGDLSQISVVWLVDENETTVQQTDLDDSGRFSFRNLAAGWYRVHIDPGKQHARIRVVSGSQEIQCDGRSSYRVDFRVD